MGGIGPLSVDGSGGNVQLETAYEMGHLDWEEGDVYPCDPDVQVGECKNSLTPLSGEASSMPAGFYWDGLLFMALGAAGLIGSMVMHFVIVPSWRARAKAMKEVEDDSEEARSTDTDEEDSEDDDEIDIGSHIGLTFEDEEIFGVIVEFDDDEETVTIEEDGTGDLVTGYQEDMLSLIHI